MRQTFHDGWERRRGLASLAGATGSASTTGRFATATVTDSGAGGARVGPSRRLRRRLQSRLLREIETRGAEDLLDRDRIRDEVARLVELELESDHSISLGPEERRHLERMLVAEVAGLGPIEPLFADPSVSDILVNGAGEVWVDRFGRLARTGLAFDDDAHLRRLIDRLVAAHGRRLDESSPYVDVRMADGSRVHAIIPPLVPTPVVSIRRARAVPFRLDELVACGSLSREMAAFLTQAVAGRLNLLVSGGAASGKTTLLNVLSGFIPEHERVVTIEETAELELVHPHVVPLEARLANVEGRGEVTISALVKNALRMRADRIIVGEVRGPEVFDMLQAMNVGHEGSLTTVHANSPEDALRRLENLVLVGGFDLPSRAIRELLAAALDLIVQTTRFADGSRKITGIHQVVESEGRLATEALFRYDAHNGRGRHVASGRTPDFGGRLAAAAAWGGGR